MRRWTLVLVGAALGACQFPALPPIETDASATDGALAPDADVAACTPATDLSSDPNHCGRCDRGCGGGTCVLGECQPVELARDIPGLKKLAVADDAIYWTETRRVASCPLPEGCRLAPRGVGEPFDRLGALAVAGDQVLFVGCTAGADSCDDAHRLFRCPASGCPLQPQSLTFTTGDFTQLEVDAGFVAALYPPVAVSVCQLGDCAATRRVLDRQVFGAEITAMDTDSGFVVVDVPLGLRACPLSGPCDAPSTIADTADVNGAFEIFAGRLFWVVTVGIPEIRSCEIARCSSASFVRDSGIAELVADDTGLYWISTTNGTIRHCPLAGCPPGGANYVARNVSNHVNLALGPGFVYYSVGGSVFRVAKP
jgi:hypothetical protein